MSFTKHELLSNAWKKITKLVYFEIWKKVQNTDDLKDSKTESSSSPREKITSMWRGRVPDQNRQCLLGLYTPGKVSLGMKTISLDDQLRFTGTWANSVFGILGALDVFNPQKLSTLSFFVIRHDSFVDHTASFPQYTQ